MSSLSWWNLNKNTTSLFVHTCSPNLKFNTHKITSIVTEINNLNNVDKSVFRPCLRNLLVQSTHINTIAHPEYWTVDLEKSRLLHRFCMQLWRGIRMLILTKSTFFSVYSFLFWLNTMQWHKASLVWQARCKNLSRIWLLLDTSSNLTHEQSYLRKQELSFRGARTRDEIRYETVTRGARSAFIRAHRITAYPIFFSFESRVWIKNRACCNPPRACMESATGTSCHRLVANLVKWAIGFTQWSKIGR